MFTIINKIMNSSLHSENSFIIDRSWQKINPTNDLKVSIAKAKEFISLLIKQHQKLRAYNSQPIIEISSEYLNSKLHSFILKFIQQKQLGFLKKGQIPFVREAQYMFDLGDCLEIWRWINQDMTSSAIADIQAEEFMTSNEFTIGHGTEVTDSKRPDASSKSKRLFKQLTLQQQEHLLKKSLEMVHMYKNQLKIVFKHYCRFPIENQHQRVATFDDFSLSLDIMTINRFMLFCREFDVIKIVEFKRKTEHDSKISKNILLSIFRKTGHLQKYMNFEGFLLSIVHIALKVHQNIDPRSYIHIQLMLNALHVRYHHQFTAKLDQLSIKYTPNEFYNCYKDILKKARNKNKKGADKITIFNNPHFRSSEPTASRYIQDRKPEGLPQQAEDRVRSYQSITNLVTSPAKVNVKTQAFQKRKSSLPILPTINNNRFFKPIQHNNHKNTYRRYLNEVEQSSSVFKNRITGYSNINHLKHQKPFHMVHNPQTVSKQTLNQLISDNKHKIQSNASELLQYEPTLSEPLNQSSLLYSKTTIHNSLNPSSFSHRQQIPIKSTKAFAAELEPKDQKQRSKVIKDLKEKVDLQDNDDLLKKHLDAEQERARSKEGRTQRQEIKA